MNNQELLAIALESVAAASRICRAVQQRLDALRSITKDDKSPVTIADFASQAVVSHVLAQHLGHDLVLVGEEASSTLRESGQAELLGTTLEAVRREWREASSDAMVEAIDRGGGDPLGAEARAKGFWTVDPIDGTKGFLRGEQYAVALAYIQGGKPVIGVLGCPNLDPNVNAPVETPSTIGVLQAAVLGHGAFEIAGLDHRGERRPIRVSRGRSDAEIVLARSVEAAHSNKGGTDAVMEAAGLAPKSLFIDSQAKYAVVARGQADIYLRLPVKKDYVERIWDHAAGALVCSEGGATVTDAAGKGLEFGHGRGLEKNRGILGTTPAIHGRLVEAIGKVFR